MEVVTMIHEMKLNNNAFNNIKSGIKKFELRLYDDRRKNINLGDTIIFHNLNNLNDTISVTFLALFTHNDCFFCLLHVFRQFSKCLSIRKCLRWYKVKLVFQFL